MLVYGVLSPHPPIILPEIGGPELEKVEKTIGALWRAAQELAKTDPEKIVIISPHEAHGFEVPWYYLGKNLSANIEVEKILVTQRSYDYYFELGKNYGKSLTNSKKRTAIIASGDLSHVLRENGPYGFNPAGPKLDKIIVKAIEKKDLNTLLKIDPKILDDGAECGLRSLIFLMSAFKNTAYKPKVLSYEGPFGVGYAVATFKPEKRNESA